MREDFLSDVINRLAIGLGIGPILFLAVVVTLSGLVMLLVHRTWKAGLVVSGVGIAIFWFGLLAIQLAEFKSKVSPQISLVRSQYSPSTRSVALYGLFLVPMIAALGAIAAWRVENRRRRSLLPIYLKNGLKAFFQQDFETALKEYSTAIGIDPHRAESFIRRGQVYLQMGNTSAALADFNRAIDIAPELGAAYRQRGMVFAARNELDLAFIDFEFALKLDTTDCAAMLQRGLCLSRMGQTERAVIELRRVLNLTNHTDHADPAREELRRLGDLEQSAI